MEKIINVENENNVSVIQGEFFEISESKINEIHMELYEKVLMKYFKKSETIVEIGAGYGSKILQIASIKNFSKNKFIAGELTYQGQELIKKLASNMSLDVNVGYCDILNGDFSELKIPKNSIIYSSYSAHYVPDFKKSLYKNFISF